MHLDLKLQTDDRSSARRIGLSLLVLGLLALAALFAAPGARAADRVYWSNFGPTPSIAYANLNGDGGGGTVNTGAATLEGPHGTAIDSARGLVYWANWAGDTGDTISYAHLDGSGGGDLDIEGATISGPHGLAIDPTVGPAGRLYWPNHAGNSISYADLDGAGGGVGGDLTITNATVDQPRGVTIDPVGGRIYWSNYSGGDGTIISYANLDGSGDGDLLQTGTTGLGPEGTAIDPLTRKIYWSDWGDKHLIEYADLDGTGVSPFNTTGASTRGVHGVAIDPQARRLYWANYNGDSISWADLGGSGGQDLNTSGTTISNPVTPSLLKAPAGTGVPQISGDSEPGSILACSPGTWAGDLLESQLYRTPQSFSYQWTRGGTDIPGAEASSITATVAGDYRCRVTATNAAGSTNQTSSAHPVGVPPDDPPTAVADQATVAEGAGASAIDVLANDTDPDGGQLELASVQAGPAAHGTVVIDPDKQGLTYEPAPGYCNSAPGATPATFTYTLNGGSQATVTVTVTCAGPPTPTLTSTNPVSPSTVATPKIKGTSAAAGTGYRIKLYVNAPTCSGPAAADSNVATFQGKGVAVPVAVGTSQIRATLTDPSGNVSACSAPIAYTRLG